MLSISSRFSFTDMGAIIRLVKLHLTHCGPVTQYGNINVGHHWFRKWFVACSMRSHWLTKKVDVEPIGCFGTKLSETCIKIHVQTFSFKKFIRNWRICSGLNLFDYLGEMRWRNHEHHWTKLIEQTNAKQNFVHNLWDLSYMFNMVLQCEYL